MVNDIYQGSGGNTPLLEYRTYFGSLVKPKWRTYGQGAVRVTKENALSRLEAKPEQIKWIDRHAPDFSFWRDEFKNEYHLYVKRPLTDNQLMLAQLIFNFTVPSHYPLGDEANWNR
jgi:hypothetical protein